ncbi:methionine ABC transporter ATP-binding protein [Bordetella genomosp. 9]|uniref:Methionine ABC transporter ATP-binding protein n=2 Tax=Bordetella genomosp. 9 TaxID=1416803 RepID=A0A261RAE2_9BORD|nr:methionine ABC transporter ATP-binding protein [Bordetella genomosp. 9]
MNTQDATTVLEVQGLSTEFGPPGKARRAIDGISFMLKRGEILCLVGESGSGKSVTGASIMGLIDPPGRIVEGSVRFAGTELRGASDTRMRALRGDRISMVFQDPMSALCPTMTIGDQLCNVVRAHARKSRAEAEKLAMEMLVKLDVSGPKERMRAYPHQLSGGMRQRICIALAMINRPDVVIGDEPTTALDVTTQAQILYEVRKLCMQAGTAAIWITHDMAVVSMLADRVAVMYAGQIVEEGPTAEILDRPFHPYTKALLGAIPSSNRGMARLPQIRGEAPALGNWPTGCRFAPRCPHAEAACHVPVPMSAPSAARQVRCVKPLQIEEEAPAT